jgi:hypothetical protein
MSKTEHVATGLVGFAATALTRAVSRRALYATTTSGALPPRFRYRRGFWPMIGWAAAAGVLLALTDVVREQRAAHTPA